MTAAACLSTVSQFDRTLARHWAARIVEGVVCDEPIVRQCVSQARQTLDLAALVAGDSGVEAVETCFVQNVVSLMESLQRLIAGKSAPIAAAFVAELLFDQSW